MYGGSTFPTSTPTERMCARQQNAGELTARASLVHAACMSGPAMPATNTSYRAPLLQLEAVLQTAIDKLAIIGLITVDPRAQALELTQHVGDEIGRMIDEQKALEARFQALVQQQPALRNMNNKAHLTANQARRAPG